MSQRPTLQSIREAKQRLQGVIHETPLIESQSLSELAGGPVKFKPECLQVTGSFKIRGAFNRIAQVAQTGAKGVVTASSGNHGQALAWAARHFGLQAKIVVPTTAPAIKVAAAEAFGAQVEFLGTHSRQRLERAQQIADQMGYVFVPPYDDPAIMSGQGTIGLEILDEWPQVRTVVVPIGGGGLISGIVTAIKALAPEVRVIGVEPKGASKAFVSRQQGRRVELAHTDSVADGLISLALGTLTYPIVEEHVDELVTVTDNDIIDAFWLLFTRLKLVVEPSGATAAAYVLKQRLALEGPTAVVLSGGNIDPHKIPTAPAV